VVVPQNVGPLLRLSKLKILITYIKLNFYGSKYSEKYILFWKMKILKLYFVNQNSKNLKKL